MEILNIVYGQLNYENKEEIIVKRIRLILIGGISITIMLGACVYKLNNYEISDAPNKEAIGKQANAEDNTSAKSNQEVQKQQSNNDYFDINNIDSIFNNPKTYIKHKEVKEDFDGDGKTDTLIYNDESTGDGIKVPYFANASFMINGSITYDLQEFDSINDVGVILINPSTGQKGFYVSSEYANDFTIVFVYKVENNKIEEVKRVSKQDGANNISVTKEAQ